MKSVSPINKYTQLDRPSFIFCFQFGKVLGIILALFRSLGSKHRRNLPYVLRTYKRLLIHFVGLLTLRIVPYSIM